MAFKMASGNKLSHCYNFVSNFPLFRHEFQPGDVRAEETVEDSKDSLLVALAQSVEPEYFQGLTHLAASQWSGNNYFRFFHYING